jgi:DNA-binding HxlR family transcriptional regulator
LSAAGARRRCAASRALDIVDIAADDPPTTYRLHERLYYCPVNLAIEALTGKWKTLIVWQLTQQRSVRYGALKRAIPGITHKMLVQSLRQLEADDLVERRVYDVVPPHVEYRLSPEGRRLEPVMLALEQFGEHYMAGRLDGGEEPDFAET